MYTNSQSSDNQVVYTVQELYIFLIWEKFSKIRKHTFKMTYILLFYFFLIPNRKAYYFDSVEVKNDGIILLLGIKS